MKTKIKIIEKFVKNGSCGSVSCLDEFCKFLQTSLYKSIYELREENKQLKLYHLPKTEGDTTDTDKKHPF